MCGRQREGRRERERAIEMESNRERTCDKEKKETVIESVTERGSGCERK